MFEDLVAVNAPVMANHRCGRIDKSDARIFVSADVQIDAQRHQGGGNPCHNARIAQQVEELAPMVPAQMQQVKRLERAIL